MSFFENTRSKWKAMFRSDSPKKPNGYYQGYLNKENKDFVKGYDWVTDQLLPSAFCDLGTLTDKHEFRQLGFDTDKIDYSLFDGETWYSDMSEEDKKAMSRETRILMMIYSEVAECIERSRNEMITSMIDGMEDSEYEANFKKVWGMSQEEAATHDFSDWPDEDDE